MLNFNRECQYEVIFFFFTKCVFPGSFQSVKTHLKGTCSVSRLGTLSTVPLWKALELFAGGWRRYAMGRVKASCPWSVAVCPRTQEPAWSAAIGWGRGSFRVIIAIDQNILNHKFMWVIHKEKRPKPKHLGANLFFFLRQPLLTF